MLQSNNVIQGVLKTEEKLNRPAGSENLILQINLVYSTL